MEQCVRFAIYFNKKLCLNFFYKYLIFLENNNIGPIMKILRDYFRPSNFPKKMDNISIRFLCTISKMFKFVEIAVLLTKIWPKKILISVITAKC